MAAASWPDDGQTDTVCNRYQGPLNILDLVHVDLESTNFLERTIEKEGVQ